jgi:hypothetical protein
MGEQSRRTVAWVTPCEALTSGALDIVSTVLGTRMPATPLVECAAMAGTYGVGINSAT